MPGFSATNFECTSGAEIATAWFRPASCNVPIDGLPSTPTAIIPTPPIVLSSSAPPRGYCSETVPSVVGQKNDLAHPYKVAAASSMATLEPEFPSQYRPTAARAAQAANSPSGEILCTIGPAKNRRTTMMLAV